MNTGRRWGVGRLVAAWILYWVAVIAVRLGSAIPSLLSATSAGDGQGNVSVSFGDTGLHIDIVRSAVSLWKADIAIHSIVLWMTIPPLLLWVVWLRAQRQRPATATYLEEGMPPDEPITNDRSPAADRRDRHDQSSN